MAPAHAVVQYQTVGPVSFSTPPNSPASIVFAPFTAAPAAQLQMVSLTGPTFNSAPMLNYGGKLTAVQLDTNPRNYTATSTPLFKFNNIQGSAFSGSANNVPLTGNPVTTAFAPVDLPASGSYTGAFNMITPSGIEAYFAGTPTVSIYNSNFAANVPDGGFASTDLTLSGPLYLTYKYDDGVTGVPAPLPIVGASVAFGFARKLRRRIQSSAS